MNQNESYSRYDYSLIRKKNLLHSISKSYDYSRVTTHMIAGIVTGFVLSVFLGSTSIGTADDDRYRGIILILCFAVFFMYLLAVALISHLERNWGKRQLKKFFLLNDFKVTNVSVTYGSDKSFMFEKGYNRKTPIEFESSLRGVDYQFFWYEFDLKAKKNSPKAMFTATHFKLPKKLPHIVLDSRNNDGLISNMPVHILDHQRIELEGNFNKHFDLFAPKDYEVETLDVLSPDFMQVILDYSTVFDIEIDGENVYILAKGHLDRKFQIEEILEATERLIEKLYQKMDVWRYTNLPKTTPDLEYEIQGRTIRFGSKRISTMVFFIPFLGVVIVFRIGIFDLRFIAGVLIVFIFAGMFFPLYSKKYSR